MHKVEVQHVSCEECWVIVTAWLSPRRQDTSMHSRNLSAKVQWLPRSFRREQRESSFVEFNMADMILIHFDRTARQTNWQKQINHNALVMCIYR